jgi:hypothetical protein
MNPYCLGIHKQVVKSEEKCKKAITMHNRTMVTSGEAEEIMMARDTQGDSVLLITFYFLV